METLEIEILQKNKIAKEIKNEVTPTCCGGEPTINEDVGCALDGDKKAINEAGCGCSAPAPTVKSNCC